uniref:F-box only protein 9 n=1 Tax=Arion vulgaris TaxID=1028688 RepID=A0A0B7AJ98_9EUPU
MDEIPPISEAEMDNRHSNESDEEYEFRHVELEEEDDKKALDKNSEMVQNMKKLYGDNSAIGENSRKSSGVQDVNIQLEVFRQKWQDELQQKPESSRGGSNDGSNVDKNVKQAVDNENEARAFFVQGMQAEDDGLLNEAIFYYRKALQLVPDIESRLGNVYSRSPRDRARQDSESSVEESDIEEYLLDHLQHLKLKEKALCLPEYDQKMTHISCLPVELIVYILHWVVSSDLDLRSLEMFSLVCHGFYVCAREERVWKKACQKVWGANLGSVKKYNGSWRRMMIERPHLLFDGCYISKVTYVRQGEQGMDSFYRPYHLVEYFRYVRFFPDGQMLMLVSPEEPLQSLTKLRYQNSKVAGILKGGYRLSDFKVTCVLKRVKSEPASNNRYKRQRHVANQNDLDMSYSVEFDVVSNGRRSNAQLVWCSYAVSSVQRSTGTEIINNFELNKRTFPSLIFSRVKSYTSASTEPLM